MEGIVFGRGYGIHERMSNVRLNTITPHMGFLQRHQSLSLESFVFFPGMIHLGLKIIDQIVAQGIEPVLGLEIIGHRQAGFTQHFF